MQVHCNACGRDADGITEACPHCGTVVSSPRRNRVTAGVILFGVVAATAEMGAVLWLMYCR